MKRPKKRQKEKKEKTVGDRKRADQEKVLSFVFEEVCANLLMMLCITFNDDAEICKILQRLGIDIGKVDRYREFYSKQISEWFSDADCRTAMSIFRWFLQVKSNIPKKHPKFCDLSPGPAAEVRYLLSVREYIRPPYSLDSPMHPHDDDRTLHDYLWDPYGETSEDMLDHAKCCRTIKTALKDLPSVQAAVVREYFLKGRSLADLSKDKSFARKYNGGVPVAPGWLDRRLKGGMRRLKQAHKLQRLFEEIREDFV